MKSVNGILLITIAFFVLWIGVTGRFPKLLEAIGILRGTPAPTPNPTPTPKTNSQPFNFWSLPSGVTVPDTPSLSNPDVILASP